MKGSGTPVGVDTMSPSFTPYMIPTPGTVMTLDKAVTAFWRLGFCPSWGHRGLQFQNALLSHGPHALFIPMPAFV